MQIYFVFISCFNCSVKGKEQVDLSIVQSLPSCYALDTLGLQFSMYLKHISLGNPGNSWQLCWLRNWELWYQYTRKLPGWESLKVAFSHVSHSVANQVPLIQFSLQFLYSSASLLPGVWQIKQWPLGRMWDWGVLYTANETAWAGGRLPPIFRRGLCAFCWGTAGIFAWPGWRNKLAASSSYHSDIWAQRERYERATCDLNNMIVNLPASELQYFVFQEPLFVMVVDYKNIQKDWAT